jgi:hypothetical protein
MREGGFCGLASSLRQIIWSEKFKPDHIDKYDGSSNPEEFIQSITGLLRLKKEMIR